MVTKKWSPTPLEVSIGQIAVLKDVIPRGGIDAIFIYGSPIRDEEMVLTLLKTVADLYKQGNTNHIVLNGLTKKMCREKDITYDGYESLQQTLHSEGIPNENIRLTEPSWHTATESSNFLAMAKAEGWSRLVIATQPHHQLRCFLQVVAAMKIADFWPKIYNLTHGGIPWDRIMKKYVLEGEMINGSLYEHIKEELGRIEKYAQSPTDASGRPSHTRHATIPEMLAYLDRRG